MRTARLSASGLGASDPVAALPEMLGVAVVEDPLAVRKLGEVEVGAEIHLEEPGSLVAEGDVPGLGADASESWMRLGRALACL